MEQLIDLFTPYTRKAVRRSLRSVRRKVQSRYDSRDFVQSAWVAFFAVPGQLERFTRPEDVLKFVIRIACNKVWMRMRRDYGTRKRDVTREQAIATLPPNIAECLVDHEPTAEEMAIAAELWQRWLAPCTEKVRRILELRRMGHTIEEVAADLGVGEHTVRRVISHLWESSRS